MASFENQDELAWPLLRELAQKLKLSAQSLDRALSGHEYAPRVKQIFLGGVRSGVNGTRHSSSRPAARWIV